MSDDEDNHKMNHIVVVGKDEKGLAHAYLNIPVEAAVARWSGSRGGLRPSKVETVPFNDCFTVYGAWSDEDADADYTAMQRLAKVEEGRDV